MSHSGSGSLVVEDRVGIGGAVVVAASVVVVLVVVASLGVVAMGPGGSFKQFYETISL